MKTKKEHIQCSATVPAPGASGIFPCSISAHVEKDGKWYCTIHDPLYVAKKNKKLNEKWDKESAILDAKYDKAKRERGIFTRFREAGLGDPYEALENLIEERESESESESESICVVACAKEPLISRFHSDWS